MNQPISQNHCNSSTHNNNNTQTNVTIIRYGEHSYEMINVTYTNEGQTLIATKITGDENVPRGEVTFTVDLAPRTSSNDDELLRRLLDPIELDLDARQRWGRKYLVILDVDVWPRLTLLIRHGWRDR